MEIVKFPNGRVAKVVEWDNHGGITMFRTREFDGGLDIEVCVPRAGGYHAQAIREHELIHARYEDTDEANYSLITANVDEITRNAVGDAFVHLRNWPKGDDAEVDADVVAMAFDDINGLYNDRFDVDISPRKYKLIALRSMATLKLLGSTEQQLEASTKLLEIFGQEVFAGLQEVLSLVERDDKNGALVKFAELSANDPQSDMNRCPGMSGLSLVKLVGERKNSQRSTR